jgi:hypothetical protein
MCRKQSGHRYAATGTKPTDLEIEGGGNISWFRSSPTAARGFCATCGSLLFWQPSDKDFIGILAASVDEPSGLRVARHVFVAAKGDYYVLTDGLPQFTDETTPAV